MPVYGHTFYLLFSNFFLTYNPWPYKYLQHLTISLVTQFTQILFISNYKRMLYHVAKSHFLEAILSVKLSIKFQVPLLMDDMAEEIESDFFKQLDAADKSGTK